MEVVAPAPTLKSKNCIVVNMVQKDNPVLKNIRNIPYEFGEIVADFLVGQATCVLYLSIQYHGMHPSYLHDRVRALGRLYRLRVLLVLVDMKDNQDSLQDLAKFCVTYNLTMILAWSIDEAARYLETFKSYEHKSADQLQERPSNDYMAQLTAVLTAIKSVNKTDVVTLASTFGCLSDLSSANMDDVRLCPGIGDRKAERIFSILDEPFVKEKKEVKDKK